ncbi:MAG: hypothetical protein JWO00_331 [Candidatus Parcubacteria bacterium]|nr:hypothetical protein [Candidatus Parcubacteria bacterium]
MTPEEKSLLERTYAIAEENNGMLKSIRRTGRLALLARILYWVVILGVSVGAYYFIQPYINQLVGIYGSVSGASVPSFFK